MRREVFLLINELHNKILDAEKIRADKYEREDAFMSIIEDVDNKKDIMESFIKVFKSVYNYTLTEECYLSAYQSLGGKTKEYAAKCYVRKYANSIGVQIWDLFSKEALLEFINQSDWDWSVKDEMDINKLSEAEALKKTHNWFLSMDKAKLWDRICSIHQSELLLKKAIELGFKE